jgi:hypothetical protein
MQARLSSRFTKDTGPKRVLLSIITCATLFGVAYKLLVRPWQLHWGATPEESVAPLSGDDLVPDAEYVTTRAITIHAPPETVWPWLAQMGQGRGGFYTYDRLEQFGGAAIESADGIMPEFQNLSVGDVVRLSPVGGPKVAHIQPGRILVLHDVMDPRTGRSASADSPAGATIHWSWSFTLTPIDDKRTRLVVRTRLTLKPKVLSLPARARMLEPVHFVMERGMLLGIKRRAEQATEPLHEVHAAVVGA